MGLVGRLADSLFFFRCDPQIAQNLFTDDSHSVGVLVCFAPRRTRRRWFARRTAAEAGSRVCARGGYDSAEVIDLAVAARVFRLHEDARFREKVDEHLQRGVSKSGRLFRRHALGLLPRRIAVAAELPERGDGPLARRVRDEFPRLSGPFPVLRFSVDGMPEVPKEPRDEVLSEAGVLLLPRPNVRRHGAPVAAAKSESA